MAASLGAVIAVLRRVVQVRLEQTIRQGARLLGRDRIGQRLHGRPGGFARAHERQRAQLGAGRRIDQPALEPESRLLGQDDGLAGVDAGQCKSPVGIGRRRGTTGREEDAGAGDRAALPVLDPARQLPERLEADVGNRRRVRRRA